MLVSGHSQHRLQEAEELAQRVEENIAFQRQMIAKLKGGGHDVRAAKMFLGGLRPKEQNVMPAGINYSSN
jgi:hypothetical protein